MRSWAVMGGHTVLGCSILFIFIRLISVNTAVFLNDEYDSATYDVDCASEHDFFQIAPEPLWNHTESMLGQPSHDRLINTVNDKSGAIFPSYESGGSLCIGEYNFGKIYCKHYGKKAEVVKLFRYQIGIFSAYQPRHQDICILLHKFHGLMTSVNTTRKFSNDFGNTSTLNIIHTYQLIKW